MKSPLGRFETDYQPHYQDLLAEVIRREKPMVVVESGVQSGYGTEWLLLAVKDNQRGHIYSIDPILHANWLNNPIVDPQFTFLHQPSHEAMVKIFMAAGPFDLFLHDSDHGAGCQTFEFEMAWDLTNPGGIIAADDATWGAGDGEGLYPWNHFLQRHAIPQEQVQTINHAVYFQKPTLAAKPQHKRRWAEARWKAAALLANEACAKLGLPEYLKL